MIAARRLPALVASVWLAACTSAGIEKPPPSAVEPEPAPPVVVVQPAPPPVIVQPPPAPEPPKALRALHYFMQLKQKPQREQRQEQERLRKAFAASHSDHDRIRLALAFSVPGSSLTEESQALELLEPMVRDSRNEYHDLAALIAALLTEQRRRGEQAMALQLKLERIKALEREMQERSSARGLRPR